MNKISKYILTLCCLISLSSLSGQTTFYVDGLGRAQVTNERLVGNAVESDTVGGEEILSKVNTGGYTMLDLGIHIEKNEKFFLHTLFRGRDEFGLFWGEGTSFDFRQITIGGIIGRGIKYELGDVFLEMTPYTLFNPELDFNEFESDIFGQRRDIVDYENFVNGNQRYLQGVKSSGTLLFTKGIEKLELYGFTVRTSKIQETGEPDYLLSGVSANAIQGQYGNLQLNFTGLYDLPVVTNKQELTNLVFTANINPKYDINESHTVGLVSEIGSSSYSYNETGVIDNLSFNDMIVDAQVKYENKDLNLVAKAGFVSVGSGFRSAGAQSRRINDLAAVQIFSDVMVDTSGNLVGRGLSYYDRFTQENLYTNVISPQLEYFNPAFNNVRPYGDATPNRTGLVFALERGDENDAIKGKVNFASLSEIDADSTGSDEKRNFLSLQLGASVDFGKLFDIDRKLILAGSYQMDKTERDGNSAIELNSSVIDAALSVEVLPKLDFLAGFKSFAAEGNEYQLTDVDGNLLSVYSTNNYYAEYNVETVYDIQETYLSLGGRFRFTDKAALTLNYSFNSFNNGSIEENDDFGINQLFINYTMKF